MVKGEPLARVLLDDLGPQYPLLAVPLLDRARDRRETTAVTCQLAVLHVQVVLEPRVKLPLQVAGTLEVETLAATATPYITRRGRASIGMTRRSKSKPRTSPTMRTERKAGKCDSPNIPYRQAGVNSKCALTENKQRPPGSRRGLPGRSVSLAWPTGWHGAGGMIHVVFCVPPDALRIVQFTCPRAAFLPFAFWPLNGIFGVLSGTGSYLE